MQILVFLANSVLSRTIHKDTCGMMKNSLLVLSAVCGLLLIFSSSVRYASALDYLGMRLNGGNYFLEHGQYSKASYYFGKVLQSYPDNSIALIGKGSALVKLHLYSEAIPYLDKALKIYPNNFDAVYEKAVALVGLGKSHEALVYYTKIHKMAPTFPLTEQDLKVIHGEYTSTVK